MQRPKSELSKLFESFCERIALASGARGTVGDKDLGNTLAAKLRRLINQETDTDDAIRTCGNALRKLAKERKVTESEIPSIEDFMEARRKDLSPLNCHLPVSPPVANAELPPGIVIPTSGGILETSLVGRDSSLQSAETESSGGVADAFREVFSEFGADVRLLNSQEIHTLKARSEDVLGCYRAGDLNWAFIAAGGAIEREQEREILEMLLSPDPAFRGACITGEPGDGKSTLAWRVALKLCERGVHVIHATTEDRSPWRLLPRFWQMLQEGEGEDARLVMLVDDFFKQGTQLEQAWKLYRNSCPIHVLATSRSGLFAQYCSKDSGVWNEVPIRAPSNKERIVLRQKVDDFSDTQAAQKANESVFESATGMLMAVNALTGGAGIERRAEDDFDALAHDPSLRIGFGWICFARQFQLSFPTSLLERLGYYRIYERPELRGRVFVEAGSVRYPNHPEYAQRFVRKLFRAPTVWIAEIAEAIDVTNAGERAFFLRILEANRVELPTGLASLGSTAIERIRGLVNLLKAPSEITSWRRLLSDIHERELAETCALGLGPTASPLCRLEDAFSLLESYNDLADAHTAILRLAGFVKSNPHALSVIPAIASASLSDEHLDALVMELQPDAPSNSVFFAGLLTAILKNGKSDEPRKWPANVQTLIEQMFATANSISAVSLWHTYFGMVRDEARVRECASKIVSLEIRTPPECAMLAKAWKALGEPECAIPGIEAFVWSCPEPGQALGVFLRLLSECGLHQRLNRTELPRTLEWLRAHPSHSASRGDILSLVSRSTRYVPMMTDFAQEALLSLQFNENLGHFLQPLLKLVKVIYEADRETTAEDYEADTSPAGSVIDIINRATRLARTWLDRFGRMKSLRANGEVRDNASVWLATLSLLKTTRNKDEFRKVAADAIDALPKDATLLTMAVEAFSDFGEEDEKRVRDIYDRLGELNPPKPRKLTLAGWLWRHGNHSEARALYEQLKNEPGQWRKTSQHVVEVHNGLGETAFYAGHYQRALEHFDDAYRFLESLLKPNQIVQNPFTLRGLAWSLNAVGRAGEAIDLIESAFSPKFRPVELLTPLAWIYLKDMNPRQAFEFFIEARDKHPAYFGNYVGLLCCHCILRWSDWEECAESALLKIGEYESDLRRWSQPMPWRGIASWVLKDLLTVVAIRNQAVVSSGIAALIAKFATPVEIR